MPSWMKNRDPKDWPPAVRNIFGHDVQAALEAYVIASLNVGLLKNSDAQTAKELVTAMRKLNAALDKLQLTITSEENKLKACFAAGTLLYTPQGYRAVESFRVGDEVFARRRPNVCHFGKTSRGVFCPNRTDLDTEGERAGDPNKWRASFLGTRSRMGGRVRTGRRGSTAQP